MEQGMQYLRALMYIAAADESISEDEYLCFSKIAVNSGLTEDAVA